MGDPSLAWVPAPCRPVDPSQRACSRIRAPPCAQCIHNVALECLLEAAAAVTRDQSRRGGDIDSEGGAPE